MEKLRNIDQEQDTALSALLTPEEKDEYQLSMSATADHLRKDLIGFNPTEEEFRELFRRQQAIDAAYAYEDMSDPSVRAAKASEEQTMMSDLKTQWGPDRAAALDRAKDPEYQNLSVLTERFDLPAVTSQTILDMRQVAEDQKQQLLANKEIPPERIEVALKAIEAETERAARETLGDAAYAQYAQTARWLQSLGRN
jgi:hypothetical protein